MKTIGTVLITVLLLLPWCIAPVFGQQSAPEGEKKIVITKRTIDADGTETTETIVKKGQAAEDFDVEQYVKENRADNVELDVRVQGADDSRKVIVKHRKHKTKEWVQDLEDHLNVVIDDVGSWEVHKHGFLGVTQKGKDDPATAGIQVGIVKESGAAAAGLQAGDVLLQLNDTPLNSWKDLTKFMKDTKPEDKVQVTYERAGQKNTVDVTLGAQKLAQSFNFDMDSDDFTFENQEIDDRQKDACLGVYSSAYGDGDSKGAKISSFTKESAAEEAEMAEGDVITAVNGVRIEGHDQLWDEIAKYAVGDKVSVDYLRDDQPRQIQAELKACSKTSNSFVPEDDDYNFDIKVREKDACLGVYTAAFGAGDAKGAKISDFTEESAAREAEMAEGDVISAVNGVRVTGHDQLWDEIAKYKVGEKVSVEFLRDDQPRQIEAELKACRDNSNRVMIFDTDPDHENLHREFFLWNWNEDDQNQMRRTQIITIRRGSEGDAATIEPEARNPIAIDRNLQLENFKAYPNPSQGQVTVEFHSEPLPTIVSLLDISGRQLFREELNAFNGDYFQQFDLTEYAKGTIVIHVLQDGKVFTEQIVVN